MTNANTATMIDNMIQAKQAPAFNTGVYYEKDMEFIKTVGAKHVVDLFGRKVANKDDFAMPANFGSKASTGFMPDDVRLRFFQLKKMFSNMELQAAKMYRNQYVTPAMYQETPIYKQHLSAMLKAYNVTDFASWIETLHTRFYFEEYEIPFVLADLFDQIPMESASMEVPGNLGLLEGVEEADDATFNPQYTTPSMIQLNARDNVVHTKITQDLMADSSPSYMDALRKNMMKGVARALERAILNGDTTVLTSVRGDGHQDSDTRALALNQTFAKAFNGIRKKCFAAEAANPGLFVYTHSDTASKTLFENVMNLMGPMASEKDDLAWIVPSQIENKLVTGAIPELFTAFAFGGLASNVTGQCPPVFGIKVQTSAYAREDLNASGVYDGTTTNRTAIHLIKKSRFAHYIRQAVRIWAAPSLPNSDQLLMSAKMRSTWNGNPLGLKEKSIVSGVDIMR